MVDYLASLGFPVARKTGSDHWYLSPLHEEKTPSFKIDRGKQVWYDHALGKGGDLVRFGQEYHGCGYGELLQKFRDYLSLPRQASPEKAAPPRSKKENVQAGDEGKKIKVTAQRPITSSHLKAYLHERGIPFSIAGQYCREVDFTLKGRGFTALGFKNDGGGYEIRNRNFKASSAPKGPTLIRNSWDDRPENEKSVAVFEGFFSFLSYLKLEVWNSK